jgi:hypothetical protein
VSFRIQEIWAFVGTDANDGDEGIAGARLGAEWFPLVAADVDRLISLRPLAEAIAKTTRRDVKLVKFLRRVDVETIRGES